MASQENIERHPKSTSGDVADADSLVWAATPFVSAEEELFYQQHDCPNTDFNPKKVPPLPKSSLLSKELENPAFVSCSPSVVGLDMSYDTQTTGMTASMEMLDSKSHVYLYGREALEHYLKYQHVENEVIQERLDAEPLLRKQLLSDKEALLKEAVTRARKIYTGFSSRIESLTSSGVIPSRAAYSTKQQVSLRRQLELLPTYKPWFTVVITSIQLLVIVVELLLGGIARLSFTTRMKYSVQETWEGHSKISHFVPSNIWLGPSEAILIRLGALFAPCIRADKLISLKRARYQKQFNLDGLGCCEIVGVGAGTTTEKECNDIVNKSKAISYYWGNITCASRVRTDYAKETQKFRPCCYGTLGQCAITSHSHCTFVEGVWHNSHSSEHCSQLGECDQQICELLQLWKMPPQILSTGTASENQKITPKLNQDKTFRFDSFSNVQQFWRLPLSLLLHSGAIHYFLVAGLQCYLAIEVEQVIGWLKLALIYLVSGIGGLLFGAVIYPYQPNVGALGAVAGLIGLRYVELVQLWPLIDTPRYKPLLQTILLTCVLIVLGFLPQMNIFTHLGGFIFGTLMAIVCLPSIAIEFSHSHGQCMSKSLMLKITTSILAFSTLTAVCLLYFSTQPVDMQHNNII